MIKKENGNADTIQYCADCKHLKYLGGAFEVSKPYCFAAEYRGDIDIVDKSKTCGLPYVIRKEYPEKCPHYYQKRSLWSKLFKWLSE